jgi:phosphatidylcholine synthase
MASLVAVLDGSPRLAVIWLLVAQLIDGIDGPLARRWLPVRSTSPYDGYVLDLVIDFVTCVVVPGAFLWHFDLLPHNRSGMVVLAALLLTSSLWFSRTDQMDDSGWFRGFPAAWNMVVPTLWLLGGQPAVNAIVIGLLVIATTLPLPFAHPVRVRQWRPWNISAMTIWIASVLVATILTPDVPWPVRASVLVGPAMVIGVVLARWIEVTSEDRRLHRG